MKFIDLTQRRIGKLLVIKISHKFKGKYFWIVKCDCGVEKTVCGNLLSTNRTQSCGCIRRKDLTGKKFGKLLVINYSHTTNNRPYYNVLCDCGTKFNICGSNLTAKRGSNCL